jgi:hypothetical protein
VGLSALLAVIAVVSAGAATAAAPAAAAPPPAAVTVSVDGAPGAVHPIPAKRLLDTRSGLGASAAGARPSGGVIALQVTGRGGVPATGVAAVALTVTVTGPTKAGYVTAYPHGAAAPGTSTVNFAAHRTVANLTVSGVSADGRVDLRLRNGTGGTAQLVADVTGYVEAGPATEAGMLTPVSPTRLLDTRTGVGARTGTVGNHSVVHLQVTGRGRVPAGAGSAVLNVTVTGGSRAGYVTVAPRSAAPLGPRRSTTRPAAPWPTSPSPPCPPPGGWTSRSPAVPPIWSPTSWRMPRAAHPPPTGRSPPWPPPGFSTRAQGPGRGRCPPVTAVRSL